MKTILCAIMVLMAGASVAQDFDSIIELLRSDLRTDKTEIITTSMDFGEAEAEVFWPVFREYQFALEKLGDEYVAIVKDYAANYDTMTDEKATELAEKAIDYREDRLKLQKKYFKKFSGLLSPILATRWLQLENEIGLFVELQLVSEIPLIER